MSFSLFSRLPISQIESQYTLWRADATAVSGEWSAFFEGVELGSVSLDTEDTSFIAPPQRVTSSSSLNIAADNSQHSLADAHSSDFRGRVALLIFAYRALGHKLAWINPMMPHAPNPERLSAARFGFSKEDMEQVINLAQHKGGQPATLQEILDNLRVCFCGYTGFEFMYMSALQARNWIQQKITEREHGVDFGAEYAKRAMKWLLEAEMFEEFIGKKFLGEKRFSLEGGEGLLVILNTILDACPENHVEEIEMGMAHRGRLNILANFLNKSLSTILYEFTPNYIPDVVAGDGDVKYHLGYEKVRTIHDKTIRLSLAANPSHLEAGDPVVEGKARARQRILGDDIKRERVLPLLIHGDAAFAGQGLVAEVFNLSQLRGYRTGGTIHIIVNNQIGFTTMPADARSSTYATDIAKMIEAPILHINGEKPMELIWAALFALEFRQKFHRDIVLDMYCYRRQGHNETDLTAFTAPTLARRIDQRIPLGKYYKNKLIEKNILTQEEGDTIENSITQKMESEYQSMLDKAEKGGKNAFSGSTAKAQPPYSHVPINTGIKEQQLDHIGKTLTSFPASFTLHPTLSNRFLPRRRSLLERGEGFDWALAESLAWGALLMDGYPVRISGQDCRRGTFSQRHAVFYDFNTRERFIPLKHLSDTQARFRIFNSALSEASVLGFEYGYSLGVPEMLTLWEAQFGDFANGAQVIIDQFIVSAESKWQTPSSIVLLLPHGYDGQGPEHSSARLERFLQLCAEDNIQVMNLSTPAQYFHALRRQKLRNFAKPLIIMTPKSMLNRAEAVSSKADFLEGTSFQEILPDPLSSQNNNAQVTRLLFCSGKLFYDLCKYRNEHNITDTHIIRLEQIYPLHHKLLQEIVSHYPSVNTYVWTQEEPANMGAWNHIHYPLEELFNVRIKYAGRPASPSPAEGAKTLHLAAQSKLIQDAFSC